MTVNERIEIQKPVKCIIIGRKASTYVIVSLEKGRIPLYVSWRQLRVALSSQITVSTGAVGLNIEDQCIYETRDR